MTFVPAYAVYLAVVFAVVFAIGRIIERIQLIVIGLGE
jgi:hypothetical protein